MSAQLLAAGFQDVGFERIDTDICILASAQVIDETARVDAALRGALAPFVKGGGVYGPSGTWFVPPVRAEEDIELRLDAV